MIDPRKATVDANVLRYNGSSNDGCVDRLLLLWSDGQVHLLVTRSLLLDHPNTPQEARRLASSQALSLPVQLTPDEQMLRQSLRRMLQGSGEAGRYWLAADCVFEASKYGGYFITDDARINGKANDIVSMTSLTVVQLRDYLDIYDRFSSRGVKSTTGAGCRDGGE